MGFKVTRLPTRALFALVVITSCSSSAIVSKYHSTPGGTFERELSQPICADSLDLDLLEFAVFVESNVQRARLGLDELRFDVRLEAAAQSHSREMVELEYFSHTSPVPENETIRKRIRKAGIKYGLGGENIAIHPVRKVQQITFHKATLASSSLRMYSWRNTGKEYTYRQFAIDLVQRWLNSPPHRSNILNESFNFLGIGCAKSEYNGVEGFYVTQNFSSLNY